MPKKDGEKIVPPAELPADGKAASPEGRLKSHSQLLPAASGGRNANANEDADFHTRRTPFLPPIPFPLTKMIFAVVGTLHGNR
jgi:hypothetical protein